MSRIIRTILILVILIISRPPTSGLAIQPDSTCEPDAQQPSGAIYRICMPAPGRWNGDLVVFAHGYVAFNEPLHIPDDQLELPGGPSLPEIVNRLGFAFATTSYRTNGLAVREGVQDLRELVQIFAATHGQPERVYLVGASEGGIITALAVEQFPELFDGGLAACGPVGNFRWQINYWGDFRVIFDYFFPDLIPGSPIEIPADVIADWDTRYEPRIRRAIWQNTDATRQLLQVTHAPIDRRDLNSVEETVLGLLWYNVFATNDGIAKLGGQPFDNTRRLYRGSDDDRRLNRLVERFQADPVALAEVERYYQTSGALISPLVTLHTTGDPIVPYWHEPLYRAKVFASGAAQLHTNIPIVRYGHCNFQASEALAGFVVLVFKVTGQHLMGAEEVLSDAGARTEFLKLVRAYSE